MKLLIVGSEKIWAIENFFIKYLQLANVEVRLFPAHDMFDDFYHSSIINKLLVRAKISNIYNQINKKLVEFIELYNFDIIWVFKGMEIYPSTLNILKQKGIKLANYNPDHPFVYLSRGSGNNFVKNSVGFYDAHFCYSIPVLKKIQNGYNIPCRWLPFAYEPTNFKFPDEDQEIIKACFIGNPDNYRAKAILKLNSAGIPIDLYGNNWNKFITSSDTIRIYPAIYKNEFNTTAPLYRLQLNLFRPHNDNSHNMRTFEMPGIGSIVLAPESEEHEILFNKNHEIFLFNNFEEMTLLASQILKLNYHDSMLIRHAAYNRCLNGGYTYQARAQEVSIWLNQIINNTLLPFNPNQVH